MKLNLKTPSWTEKRGGIRLDLEATAQYRLIERKWKLLKNFGPVQSADLEKPSLVGLRLCGGDELPKGTEVAVEVNLSELEGPASCKLECIAVWSEFSKRNQRQETGLLITGGADQKTWEAFIGARL